MSGTIYDIDGNPILGGYSGKYRGKTFSIFGASNDLPWTQHGTVTEDLWWFKVASIFQMTLLVNNSESGSTVCGDPGGTYTPGASGRNKAGCGPRAEYLGKNPNVVFMAMGYNDHYKNLPMGSYNGHGAFRTDGQTFTDAFVLMLTKVKAKYPDAEVWIMTKGSVAVKDNETFPAQSNGITQHEFFDLCLDLGRLCGCKPLDMRFSGMNYWNREVYMADYNPATGYASHYNPLGHSMMANAVIEIMDPTCQQRVPLNAL